MGSWLDFVSEKAALGNAHATLEQFRKPALFQQLAENILKMEFFGNHNTMIIVWSPCPTRPQIHNDRLLLCFKLSPTYGDEKYLMRLQNENTIGKVCTGL